MAREDEIIDSFTGRWGFLSNFSLDPVTLEAHSGIPWNGTWRTAEHLYQAMKTTDLGAIDRVRSCVTPAAAKRLGRRVPLRPDWEEVKVTAMTQVIVLKFPTGSVLAERLINTGEAELIEGNTWGDTFWGVSDGVGHNHLGRLLMHRRELLVAAVAYRRELRESLEQMRQGEGIVRVPLKEDET